MDNTAILLDIITLIIRETQADVDTNSDTMIRSIIELYDSDDKKWNQRNRTLTKKLISIINDILSTRESGEQLDLDSISRQLGVILSNDEELQFSDDGDIIVSIAKSITNNTKTIEECNREIKRLKSFLTMRHAKEKVKSVFNSKNFKLSKSDMNANDVFKFIDETIEDLDKIRSSSVKADEAIMGEIDLSSNDIVAETEKSIVVKHVFKTGCKALNRMLQGGIRTSEFTTVAGLSHNYKTGWTLSMWVGMLINNPPKPCEEGMKPLAIWLSFEDDLINIIESIYKMIYISDHGTAPDMGSMSLDGMVAIVQERLQRTGFTVKILRVDPTLWTYKDIFNKIASYRSKKLETQILVVDYLDKLPTVGLGTGIMGSEKKDLVKRVRNHMAGFDIAFITPWQLSSGANALIKDGMSGKDLLSYVWDKSYYQGNNTLSTEIDLEIFVNKAKFKTHPTNKYWLNIHRGKHKIPSVIKEEDMSFWLPFPQEGMIPFDEGTDNDISVKDPSIMESTSTSDSIWS